ncbi:MAG: tRNA 4-thiouridine(8) synthase ThiI [Alteromonadaceae bacterium]|jgi:thiamine biosynthesis protein ThiI|uniref:tRNA sulfurtransferase n=7 Tax=Rheinheimera TaxID=67575 RepID=A0ABP3NVH4_9GAMM|nr:tRNA uracil 4-sulfurtransferase ThiI [Rheinheimera aquimaris]MBJ91177.1 tRNA 4-thiouridine(8) synthase ThiI [Alteromonadaceae bacterium]MCB5213778.1 tRNA 4-thiouridine(8) synthase ThiI [Rheinheimera aquimaris]HBN90545.1 tRNA 4-thiouridine(8) synthase ThiI [Rheinheimera sp.]|tara:strand:+ start:5404 stop:6861 length:1458 start_codon:yes stop_codon:yes gene_type:complete
MIEFIIKLHPEIAIKSKSVRKRQTLLLERNIKTILLRTDSNIEVNNNYDHLTIRCPSEDVAIQQQLIDRLSCIPGIVHFSEMQSSTFSSLHDIYEQVAAVYAGQIQNKTFCVRVRRAGKHDFSSIEAERYIGGGLNQLVASAQVKLTKPDIVVALEVRKDQLIMVRKQHQGMGGFPLPSQSDVLSLISGGYDSAVASYLMIRKGLRTHYLFFNLGGAAHEAGVREMAHLIWQKYSLSHKVKFVSVNFAPVVDQILETIDNGLMGVVLKRMMMRAASTVAEKLGIKAIVTGESIGQVSSQTIANLNVIDRVTETLILRPLIYQDKQEIIALAAKIGAEDIAKSMPEYCGVISRKPTVNAVLAEVIANEQNFDFAVLDQAVQDAKVLDIRTIDYQAEQQADVVTVLAQLPADAVVLDIRSPEETDVKPLTVEGHDVVELPFFRLASQFANLDQSKHYYCYCERGVMSRLQAVVLQEQGFKNVSVYRP